MNLLNRFRCRRLSGPLEPGLTGDRWRRSISIRDGSASAAGHPGDTGGSPEPPGTPELPWQKIAREKHPGFPEMRNDPEDVIQGKSCRAGGGRLRARLCYHLPEPAGKFQLLPAGNASLGAGVGVRAAPWFQNKTNPKKRKCGILRENPRESSGKTGEFEPLGSEPGPEFGAFWGRKRRFWESRAARSWVLPKLRFSPESAQGEHGLGLSGVGILGDLWHRRCRGERDSPPVPAWESLPNSPRGSQISPSLGQVGQW